MELARATFFDAVEDAQLLMLSRRSLCDLSRFVKHVWLNYGGRVRVWWAETPDGPFLMCDLYYRSERRAERVLNELMFFLKKHDSRLAVRFRHLSPPRKVKIRRKKP